MSRRWFAGAAIALFVMAAIALAFLAFQSMRAPLGASLGFASPSTEPCSPAPCRDVQGYTLWVSNLKVDGKFVRMQIKFKNSSAATHASPEDVQLIDGHGHSFAIATDAPDCNTWSRHEFSNGATYGPIDICFHVSDTTGPFTLRWTPDLGFICCETELPIKPS